MAMSSLIKELLHDYTKNNLDIDTRVSITYAIESLCKSGVFSKQDIFLLEYYYRGYSAEEIALQFILTTDAVISTLARLLLAIEFSSGYLDEAFLNKISAKYSPRQIQHAKTFMEKYSKEFTYEAAEHTTETV
jgi:hypothetical protein